MSLVINHNMMAMNAARNLGDHYGNLADSTRRLSSGLRVDTAADDAAGLAVRELMRADIAAMNQGIRNANDGISALQTADGSLEVIDNKLIRMKELAEQAATGTYTAMQRQIIDGEFQEMKNEINRIARSTEFNQINLLDGKLSENGSALFYSGGDAIYDGQELSGNINSNPLKIHFGPRNTFGQDYYYVDIADATAAGLGIDNTYLRFTTEAPVERAQEILAYLDGLGSGGLEDLDSEQLAMYLREIQNHLEFASGELTEAVSELSGSSIISFVGSELSGAISDMRSDLSGGISSVSGAMASLLAGSGMGTIANEISSGLDYVNQLLGRDNEIREDGYSGNNTLASVDAEMAKHITTSRAQEALVTIDEAIEIKDRIRADLGAYQNRLSNTISNLQIQAENLQAAESRISDVDVALEMTNFMRNQVLAQGATAMLAQANTLPQMAMQLMG